MRVHKYFDRIGNQSGQATFVALLYSHWDSNTEYIHVYIITLKMFFYCMIFNIESYLDLHTNF